MSQSPVGICNLALALIGKEPIRNFTDEHNERARMCERFYEATRDRILGAFDWGFARKLAKLQKVVDPNLVIPTNWYAYQLPADCKAPRDVHPPGNRQRWRITGDMVLVPLDPVYLWYTALVEDASLFSDGFIDMLSIGLAEKLCMPLTHDKALKHELRNDFREAELNAHDDDANAGSEYREYDSNPNNDTFVNADVAYDAGVSEL